MEGITIDVEIYGYDKTCVQIHALKSEIIYLLSK